MDVGIKTLEVAFKMVGFRVARIIFLTDFEGESVAVQLKCYWVLPTQVLATMLMRVLFNPGQLEFGAACLFVGLLARLNHIKYKTGS